MAAVTICRATAGPPIALSLKSAVIMRQERRFTGGNALVLQMEMLSAGILLLWETGFYP